MRERMRKELSAGDAARFDIKQDPGGIADIEFLAQYWALLWAREYPPVAMFSDTIRQLESVASRTWCRRRASTCSPGPIGSTAPRPICCSSRAPRSARRARFRDTRAAVIGLWNAAMVPEVQGAQV